MHTLDAAVRDIVDHHRLGKAGRFEDRRHDVDDMVELVGDALAIYTARPSLRHSGQGKGPRL